MVLVGPTWTSLNCKGILLSSAHWKSWRTIWSQLICYKKYFIFGKFKRKFHFTLASENFTFSISFSQVKYSEISKFLKFFCNIYNVLMGLGQFFVARVSHLRFGFGFGKSPLKIPNFSIFFHLSQKNLIAFGQKVPRSKTGRPLIYCGSKVCLGQGSSLPFIEYWQVQMSMQTRITCLVM